MTFFFPLGKGAAPRSQWTLDQGVDIAAPAHTPLLAVGDGTIVRHGITGFGDWAPVLKLADGSGYVYYGHAGPGNLIKDGTKVKGGQVIGEVGAGRVGISTGPHLEIGFADVRGNPVGPKTAKEMVLNLVEAKTHKPFFDPGAVVKDVVGAGAGAANTVADAPAKAAEAAGQATAKAIVSGLWDSFGQQGKYAGLVVVLIVGGAVAAFVGLKRTAGGDRQKATA